MRPMLQATAAAILAAATMAGCQHKQPPSTQPIFTPATSETAKEVREEYQKRDKSAAVGLVIAVLPESNLASVGDVPVGEFKPGQVVTFIDSNQTTIAVGQVVNVVADAVHVKYTPQGEMPRAPREGDLAVKLGS